ncbi:MAG TPA: hypothetical protein PKM43_02895 [Verrucomicrobiota bacterium]|nr:hypothetical protein [Verrucomicrobiota bacterium]
MSDLPVLKHRYRIPAAWRDLGLPGEPGRTCRSPWPNEHSHGDANPSFSIFDDGRRWKDFATGEGGDVLDLIAKSRGCRMGDAIRWVEDRLGVVRPDRKPSPNLGLRIPPLRRGTKAEHRELCERRGFSVEGLGLAEERGFLRFTELFGHAAWCVCDQRQELFEFRRLDGRKWPAYGRLGERKSHACGSKRWPLGVLESVPFPSIVLVEGSPDFLAACHFIVVENKERTVAPVAVLGASNHRLDPAALAHLADKPVCIYPHVDDAGRRAAREWALALKSVGVTRVTAFDLSCVVLVDGTEGKDLADVCRIAAECWEREMKFREVLP